MTGEQPNNMPGMLKWARRFIFAPAGKVGSGHIAEIYSRPTGESSCEYTYAVYTTMSMVEASYGPDPLKSKEVECVQGPGIVHFASVKAALDHAADWSIPSWYQRPKRVKGSKRKTLDV